MTRSHARAIVLSLVSLAVVPLIAQRSALAPISYTSDGSIPVPDYSKWVFIGAGAFDTPQTAPAPRFSNVFVDPAAYDVYAATGAWPDRTVIFSEKRAGITTTPITANPGWGQTGEPLGFEFEVKDASRGGWRYYTAGAGERVGKPVANQADCTTCHAKHAAVDNTFVQFYPSLVAPAKRHGTFRMTTE
jgi:hypothetical protein